MMAVSRFTLAAAFVVLTHTVLPAPVGAQASREGPSFTAAGPWGTVRLPDASYDPANGVYLVVSGNLTHGRFVTQDGVPLGAQFDVPTVLSHNQGARVAYSPDLGGFLVTWYDTRVNPNVYQVWGRLVRLGPNGAPLFTGPDFFIGAPAGGGNAEIGMDVAYATGVAPVLRRLQPDRAAQRHRRSARRHDRRARGRPAPDRRGQPLAA